MPAMLSRGRAKSIAGMARSYKDTSRIAGMARGCRRPGNLMYTEPSPTMFNIHWVHCRHRGSRGNA